jgi:DNA-binding transcriptional regulator YbjK
MSNEAAFAAFWAKEFPDIACPPVPRDLSELNLTAQMAMQSAHPQLYTAMFAGTNEVRLPADVSVRLQSGQLEPGDASALRAAGFEQQAQQCERLQQMQQDQRLADQALASRENYQQARAQSAAWSEMGLLERLGHAPLTQDQIAANRERYGVTGK